MRKITCSYCIKLYNIKKRIAKLHSRKFVWCDQPEPILTNIILTYGEAENEWTWECCASFYLHKMNLNLSLVFKVHYSHFCFFLTLKIFKTGVLCFCYQLLWALYTLRISNLCHTYYNSLFSFSFRFYFSDCVIVIIFSIIILDFNFCE